MSLVIEQLNKNDADFREFWESLHPLTFEEMGFDASLPLHRAWVEKGRMGRTLSAVVFVPLVQDGVFHGHHAYLSSHRRSKALVTFCRNVMEVISKDEGFGFVCIQTRQMEGYEAMDKLAKMLGFAPVYVPEHDFTDFVWNSKESSKRKEILCHQ